jgi:hypothetical protein
MVYRCVDGVDMPTQRKQRSKLDKTKWTVGVVDDDDKLLGGEQWALGAKLREIVSVDEYPVSVLGLCIRKTPAVRIPRIKHPRTAVRKRLSGNHIG